MIHIKYCIKCKRAFDIGTDYDICPECKRKNRCQEKIGEVEEKK